MITGRELKKLLAYIPPSAEIKFIHVGSVIYFKYTYNGVEHTYYKKDGEQNDSI